MTNLNTLGRKTTLGRNLIVRCGIITLPLPIPWDPNNPPIKICDENGRRMKTVGLRAFLEIEVAHFPFFTRKKLGVKLEKS